jgi:hypothetical protein
MIRSRQIIITKNIHHDIIKNSPKPKFTVYRLYDTRMITGISDQEKEGKVGNRGIAQRVRHTDSAGRPGLYNSRIGGLGGGTSSLERRRVPGVRPPSPGAPAIRMEGGKGATAPGVKAMSPFRDYENITGF